MESVVPEAGGRGAVPGAPGPAAVPCSDESSLPCCGGLPSGRERRGWGPACALLVVANQGTRALWSFNVKGCQSGGWGADVLEGAIAPGESRAWELAPGTYHLRVETADGSALHHFGLELRAGQLARWVVEDNGG